MFCTFSFSKKKRNNKQIYTCKLKLLNILLEQNEKRRRIVIITQGPDPTIVYQSGDENPVEYPVIEVDYGEIVDTNGVGDAFAGGNQPIPTRLY